MYLQKKSDWESFHRVYFLAEDSVELILRIYTIFTYKENNKKNKNEIYVQKSLPVYLEIRDRSSWR